MINIIFLKGNAYEVTKDKFILNNGEYDITVKYSNKDIEEGKTYVVWGKLISVPKYIKGVDYILDEFVIEAKDIEGNHE